MMELNEVRRALSQLREEISPTPDDKARLRARILAPAASLAHESLRQDATRTPPALTPWAALKAAGTLGVATGLALLGVGGGVGFWLGHGAASARSRSVPALEVAAGAAETPALARASRALPADAAASSAVPDVVAAPVTSGAAPASDSRRRDVPPRAHAARRRAPPNRLNDELALLRRVERALRNNEPALARALLGELDERFPDSRLGEERSAARCIADCRSGEPGAGESARAFLREHGASVYRKRIALACALDGEPREESDEGAPMKDPE